MTWEDVVRKLTSRKLWMALAGFVSGLLIAAKVDAQMAETIGGLILSAGSVVAYIVGEGLADAAHVDDGAVYDFYEDDGPVEDLIDE